MTPPVGGGAARHVDAVVQPDRGDIGDRGRLARRRQPAVARRIIDRHLIRHASGRFAADRRTDCAASATRARRLRASGSAARAVQRAHMRPRGWRHLWPPHIAERGHAQRLVRGSWPKPAQPDGPPPAARPRTCRYAASGQSAAGARSAASRTAPTARARTVAASTGAGCLFRRPPPGTGHPAPGARPPSSPRCRDCTPSFSKMLRR